MQSLTHPLPVQAHIYEDVNEIYQTRIMGFVSFTVLVYDHLISFPAEVEYIWKWPKGALVSLFFFNRYVMPLGFIVNLVAYNLEYWPDKTCERYVRYEGVMTAVGVEVVGLMMLIRINALYYDKSRLVVPFMACILLAETVINVYLLVYAIPVEHWNTQNQVHSCSMIYGSPKVLSAAAAWIPLLYDTIVLLLTLYVTVPSIRRSEKGFIVRTILTDGLRYYAVICVVTMVLTIMIAGAPPGLKNITAQLQLLLTVTMMSRITIHLKTQVHAPSAAGHSYDEAAADVTFSRDRSFSDVMARTRSHSWSSGHGDFGITFVRPPPARFLSTIWSERNSGTQTPMNGVSPTPITADISELISARVRERQQNEQEILHISNPRNPRRGDEESF